MASEALEWAQTSHQELTLLLLDFEKANDMVSWQFLRACMTHIGFYEHWVNLVLLLYREASAAVILNGRVGKKFNLQRSVRQGCPLAPYLYILVADVLGHMLDDEERGL